MREIQGFSRVGDKRECSEDKIQKRVKTSRKEFCENPEIVLKYRNSLQFLNNRELGVTAGKQAEKEFYHMKITHREMSASSNLSIPFTYDSCEVNLIKGDRKSLFGVWCLSNDHKENNYVVGKISYNMNNEDCVPETYVGICENIKDMCRISTGSMVVLRSVSPEDLPCFINILNVIVPVDKEYCPPPWYCCCFLDAYQQVVIGGDGFTLVICGEGFQHHYQETFPGKVLTLSQHEPSGQLLAGLDTGEFCIQDPRTDSHRYSVKISDKAINDSVFVNNQEVIVTDVEGKLAKVDLRTRKTSAMFFGHKHSHIKRPFSVANDMLCATGVDNVVRIWHISGGHPICVQKSTSGHEVRSWLNSNGNKTYLNYFEGDKRTVFTV